MSRIRNAIAMSDLHLGSPESFLHSNSPFYEKNRNALLELLRILGPREELIINGDFLELAITGHDAIYRDVKSFFSILSEAGPYDRIVYIPGNHDHHFWRSLVELMNIDGNILKGIDPPGRELYLYCFVDARFSSKDKNLPYEIMLSRLWPEDKEPPEIVVKYPHHLVRIEGNDGKEQCYLFTHGHYLESLFKPVNFLIRPALLEELEAFNNIWLEAFNYNIGHAGKLSVKAIELLESYQKREKEAKETVLLLLKKSYEFLKDVLKLRWPKTLLLKHSLKLLFKKITFESKSGLFDVSIDEPLKESIAHYIAKYVLHRYKRGKAGEYYFPRDTDIPTPFTFVFGHTHRPIREEDRNYAKVFVQGNIYPLLNTGGWIRSVLAENDSGTTTGLLAIDTDGSRWESLEGKLK